MNFKKQIISAILVCTTILTSINLHGNINKNINAKADNDEIYVATKNGHAYATLDQKFGLCIDHRKRLREGDIFKNQMIDLRNFTYGTQEYEQALERNVSILKENGINEQNATELFWTGISVWKADRRKNPADPSALQAVDYWYQQSIDAAKYSIANGYMPNIGNLEYSGVKEADLGTIRSDNAFSKISNGKPLLKYLGNYNTMMGETRVENYPNVNAVMPRLSENWLKSYNLTSEKSGYALWTANAENHKFSMPIGSIPNVELVKNIALSMDKDENYQQIIKQPKWEQIRDGANPLVKVSSENKSNSNSEEYGSSSNSNKKEYFINMNGYFLGNSGPLMLYNNATKSWTAFSFVVNPNASIVVNGWEVKYVDDTKGSRIEFKYISGDTPQGLVMYFDIPANSIASVGTKAYKDPIHFVATYINLFKCIKAKKDGGPELRQMFISFKGNNDVPTYPAYMLGDPIPPDIPIPGKIDFKIYRHTEDWTSHYNVKLEKKDYETNKPLQGANFSLYERFDDKEEINQENDGNKELYLGIKETENKQWQSGYLSSPVIWNNFRKVFDQNTDNKGIIDKTVEKKYHYEKTFCNGHPAPKFEKVPEPEYEEDENGNQKEEASNQDEIDEAKERNKDLARKWITYYEEDIKMAEERKGVHFHWLMNGVDEGKIREIAETGGEEGETPNAGPTEGASIEESFKNSNCKEDCKGTYDKFINLKYSYTWIETKARDGYIRHDNHPDDVPIEVITTNSSEGGAKSEFSNLYSRNIEINNVESNNKNISIPKIPQIINSYENIYITAFNDAFEAYNTGGSKVKLGKKNIYSHINDKNSEMNKWRIYDHRTEGEIHFNKKDLYLKNKENNLFNAYSIANGDSSLQGAVYGLFASEDVIHPDGKTGVVYKKGDLVSIGTTDRNGNGSFMTFTEKPGTRYNYKTGLTYETDWTNEAPENNFDLNKKDSYADTDSSMNSDANLRNTHFYVDDYTEDSTYKNGKTERIYDDNKGNNGNSWIGRPLILGEYYIKELSRSEGYELSIGNKNNDITNFGQDENAENKEETYKGKVNVTTKTYIDPQNEAFAKNEVLFEVTSKDTGNLNHGYDVVIDNLPENAIINRVDYITRPEEKRERSKRCNSTLQVL